MSAVAMETICFEMATYVSRTATTPILNQSNERNATILDAQGRLVVATGDKGKIYVPGDYGSGGRVVGGVDLSNVGFEESPGHFAELGDRFGVATVLAVNWAPALITTLPLEAVAVVTVSGSPSTSLSLASTGMITGVSSLVVAVSGWATGASLTGVTVTVTVAVAKPPVPSRPVRQR